MAAGISGHVWSVRIAGGGVTEYLCMANVDYIEVSWTAHELGGRMGWSIARSHTARLGTHTIGHTAIADYRYSGPATCVRYDDNSAPCPFPA